MHTDLLKVVATSIAARDRLIAGELSVKKANAIARRNRNILSAYERNLRERLFIAEMTGAKIARRTKPKLIR